MWRDHAINHSPEFPKSPPHHHFPRTSLSPCVKQLVDGTLRQALQDPAGEQEGQRLGKCVPAPQQRRHRRPQYPATIPNPHRTRIYPPGSSGQSCSIEQPCVQHHTLFTLHTLYKLNNFHLSTNTPLCSANPMQTSHTKAPNTRRIRTLLAARLQARGQKSQGTHKQKKKQKNN